MLILLVRKFLLKLIVLRWILIFGNSWLNWLILGISYWLVKFGGVVIVIVFLLFLVSSCLVVFWRFLKIFFSFKKYVCFFLVSNKVWLCWMNNFSDKKFFNVLIWWFIVVWVINNLLVVWVKFKWCVVVLKVLSVFKGGKWCCIRYYGYYDRIMKYL